MIRFEQVSFSYTGGKPDLDRFDIRIEPGLTLLVGPNGAGKSTVLRLAAGIQKPDNGAILIDGADLWVEEERARRRLTYLPDHADLTPYATITETMRMVGRVRGIDASRAEEILDQVGLGALGSRSIRELSFGQRRRAMLAAVMIGKLPVMLLDEPLDGMDREMRDLILNWIAGRRDEGATIVLSSHELESFEHMTDRVVGLSEGRLQGFQVQPDNRMLESLARGVHCDDPGTDDGRDR